MTQRNLIIDFWRGLALMMIFINHVPGNFLENLTSRNFGFSDGAEGFVFLAGLTIAMVFTPAHREVSFATLALRCGKRALQLYRIHIILSFCVLGAFAIAYAVFDIQEFRDESGRALVFDDPGRAFLGILLLLHQFDYVDILPLYVVLMLYTPVMLALLRWNVGVGLAVSLAIYGLARLGPLDMPTWPMQDEWFFNPFAWQLIFTLGAASCFIVRRHGAPRSKLALAASLVIVAASALVMTDAFGRVPGLMVLARETLDSGKHELGLLRLIHFIALAYALAVLPVGAWLTATRFGQEMVRMGQFSLPVFAFSTFLCKMCQLTMTAMAVTLDFDPLWVGLVSTLAGLVMLLLQARYLEWTKRNPGLSAAALARSTLAGSALPLLSPLSRSQSRP